MRSMKWKPLPAMMTLPPEPLFGRYFCVTRYLQYMKSGLYKERM